MIKRFDSRVFVACGVATVTKGRDGNDIITEQYYVIINIDNTRDASTEQIKIDYLILNLIHYLMQARLKIISSFRRPAEQ